MASGSFDHTKGPRSRNLKVYLFVGVVKVLEIGEETAVECVIQQETAGDDPENHQQAD